MKKLLPITLALIGASSLASAQTFTSIAFESFDYAVGGLGANTNNGGTGWANAWWSDGTGINALVTSPSIDAIGNKCTTSVEHGGSWRVIDGTPFPAVTVPDVNGLASFGVDGTTVWLSYSQQRIPGGDNDYGGLSLQVQFVGEMAFFGSPGGTNEMGVDTAFCCGGSLATIPGSSSDNLHRVVVKIDFQAGDEDISMWLDPPVPHPDPLVNAPDLTTTAPDFIFNEIRLQSGTGAVTGFDFDEILFELEENPSTIGTNFCIATVNSTGSASTISGTGSESLSANDLVLTADSLPDQPGIFIAGPGQGQVPFFNGFLCVDSNGLQRFADTTAPSGGSISEAVDYGTSAPGGLNAVAGSSYFYQRWNRDPAAGGGNANFSDGLEIVHTP